MPVKFSYDDSEQAKSRAISPSEIDAFILNGGSLFTKNPRHVLHLLERVRRTIALHREEKARLHTELERIRVEKTEHNRPFAQALELFSLLSDEEKSQLMDQTYMRSMAELEDLKEQAEMARAVARNDVNRLRMMLAELENDQEIGPIARQKMHAALTRLEGIAKRYSGDI